MKFTKLLIIFLLLIIIITLLLVLRLRPNTSEQATTGPGSSTSPELINPKTIDKKAGQFSVIEVAPDTSQLITDRFTVLQITFNKPVLQSSIKFTLIPNNRVSTNFYLTKTGSSILEIIPLDAWKDLTNYQMILSNNIQSQDGTYLAKDYIINFKIEAYLGI